MAVVFYVNGRPVLRAYDCGYSVDCPLIQYIKREKFLCNITEVDDKNTIVSLTVFNTDAVATNLWTVHNTHKAQKLQQLVKDKVHAL